MRSGWILYGRYTAEAGGVLIVELAGDTPAMHALSNYGVLPVVGPLGVSQIEIGPKGARVLSAPCVHKICMRQGWMQRAGDVAACVAQWPSAEDRWGRAHRRDDSLMFARPRDVARLGLMASAAIVLFAFESLVPQTLALDEVGTRQFAGFGRASELWWRPGIGR